VELPGLLRRGFPWLVLGPLATSAGFVANGVSALIEAELLPSAGLLIGDARPALATRPPESPRASAAPLIERNPFDSVTGSLLPKPAESAPAPTMPTVDPLTAPPCIDVDVYSTLVSTDAMWSSAVVQGPGEPHGQIRRVGDAVGAWQLVYIGRNPIKQSPAVWLLEGANLCQALLFDGKPRRAAAAPAPPPPAKPPAPKPPAAPPASGSRAPAPLTPEIAAKIRRISASEFLVDRSAVDGIMADYAALVRGSRIRPQQKDGSLTGFRVDRIGQGTLLATLGLQDGDQIQSINGFPLSSPDKALRAYASLRTASELRLRLVRDGKPMTVDYRIR
jgi:general secretion pathway protein C